MRSRFAHAYRFALDNTLLMVAGALIALVWANTEPASYARVSIALRFAVNDVAMVFFFGLAVKEIVEAASPGGPLHSLRRAAVPILAAIGGMAGPALVFVGLAFAAGRPDVIRGWAIPCATDIAFSYLIARLIFGPSHPAVPFLLLLAIADDAFGLALIAIVYPSGQMHLVYFAALVGIACALAWLLRRQGINNFWPYLLIPGAVSWAGFYVGGVHPALALAPIIPLLPRTLTLSAFEDWWSTPVEAILFLFALTNAGVAVSSAGAVTWLVLAALAVGKPVGIISATWLAERAGLRRPAGLSWRDLAVLGMTAAIGFTVALFFATAAFDAGPNLDQAKLGALLSVSAALLAFGAAKLLNVTRARVTTTFPAR